MAVAANNNISLQQWGIPSQTAYGVPSAVANNNFTPLMLANGVQQAMTQLPSVVTHTPTVQTDTGGTTVTASAVPPVIQQPIQIRPAGSSDGLSYISTDNGGFLYGDQRMDANGYQSTFRPQVNVARNAMQQKAYNDLLRSADASYEQNRAATYQDQAKAATLETQADPNTYKLADYYANTMGLNAQEALNLATTERERMMGMWGAAGLSTAPTQQSLNEAALRNVGSGLAYGYDVPYQESKLGYGAATGLNGVGFADDGTVTVTGPNGQRVSGISPNAVVQMLGASGSPVAAAKAVQTNAAKSVAKALQSNNYGSFNKAAMSMADKIIAGQDKKDAQAAKTTAKEDAKKPKEVHPGI